MIAVEAAPDTLGAGTLQEILDIEGRLRRNPYGMVAGAVAVGFVLGGGLFTRLTARIVGVGLRVGVAAAWPLLQQQLFAKTQENEGTKQETKDEEGRVTE
jgi:hypothetical protein